MAVRDNVLEAAADLVPIEAPTTLIESETRRRVEDLAHRLQHQGVTIEQYLAGTGQEAQAFLDEVRQGAGRAVLADLALRAVVVQESIDATEEELSAEVARIAERLGKKPEKIRRDLEKQGAIEAVRSDVARGKALEFLVEHAKVVDPEGNELDLTLNELTTDNENEADEIDDSNADEERPDA
jgi:trigger factor